MDPLTPLVSHALLWTAVTAVAAVVYSLGLWAERRTADRCTRRCCRRHAPAAWWLDRSVGSQTWRDR